MQAEAQETRAIKPFLCLLAACARGSCAFLTYMTLRSYCVSPSPPSHIRTRDGRGDATANVILRDILTIFASWVWVPHPRAKPAYTKSGFFGFTWASAEARGFLGAKGVARPSPCRLRLTGGPTPGALSLSVNGAHQPRPHLGGGKPGPFTFSSRGPPRPAPTCPSSENPVRGPPRTGGAGGPFHFQ